MSMKAPLTVSDYPIVEALLEDNNDYELRPVSDFDQIAIYDGKSVLWCICVAFGHPPQVLLFDKVNITLEHIGYMPNFHGLIKRLSVDDEYINMAINDPDDGELYYEACIRTLSYRYPRGRSLTEAEV